MSKEHIFIPSGYSKSEVNKMDEKKRQPTIDGEVEKPISKSYPVIDTDLARDNIENNMPAADLQDL